MRIIAIFFLVFTMSACSTTGDIYYWGNYENLLYEMYATPGKASPLTQTEKLTRDIQIAHSRGKPVPPGVYAHLGFIYTIQNNAVQAEESFFLEKKLYPESSTFIDGMMKRANMGIEQ